MEHTLPGLQPASSYQVWVQAFTAKHEGERSAQLTVRTDVSAPSAPRITAVRCGAAGGGLVVQWRGCPGLHHHCVYSINVTSSSAGSEVSSLNTTAASTSNNNNTVLEARLPGSLVPDTVYSVQVAAATRSMYRCVVRRPCSASSGEISPVSAVPRSGLEYPSPWSEAVLVAPRPGPDCSLRFPAPGPARPAPPEQRGQLQPGPGVIAGIVLAALAAAALLAALVVWNRFCRESYYYLEESGSKAATNIATQWETEVRAVAVMVTMLTMQWQCGPRCSTV